MSDRDGWRAPSEAERDVLRVLALAEFPGRDAASAQLDGVRVREVRCSGLTSLDLSVPAGHPPLTPDHGATLVEAEGEDEHGRRFTATIYAADGRLTRLDMRPLEPVALGTPAAATLRQLDAVPRGTLELMWLVPHAKTILEEYGDREAPPGDRIL